jgi:DNA polymerase delta subunit 1
MLQNVFIIFIAFIKAMDTTLALRAIEWRYHNFGYHNNHEGDIHCWALNRNNKPCLLRIVNFPITLYLELPFLTQFGRKVKWQNSHVVEIMDTLSNIIVSKEKNHEIPLSANLVDKKLFYWYGSAKPMVEFKFPNITSMYHAKTILENSIYLKNSQLQVTGRCIGGDINPVLAYTTERKLKHANWLQVNNYVIINDKIAQDNILEYCANYEDVYPIAEEICQEWQVYPTILSWDIETYSPNHRHFPNASLIACKVTVISAIFDIYDNDSQKYKSEKHVLLLGDVDNEVIEQEVTLHRFSPIEPRGELALLYEFCNLIAQYDPDVLIGYNTDGFDYPYLDKRFIQWVGHKWPNISRLKEYECKLKENTWKSAAYGINSSSSLDMEGRINIDMMTIIKRDHKLPKYSLNYVSQHFLQDKKDDMSAKQMFEAYEDIYKLYKNPQSSRKKEILQQWGLVVKYAIQDTALVINLFNHLEVWNYLSESADITHVNIVDTFTRGQQIRSFSLIYDYCTRYGYVVDTRQTVSDGYTGGYVREPIVGVHDCVIVLDFESLYPNVMRANNLCPTTLINPRHYDDIPENEVNIIEFTQEEDLNAKINKEIKEYNDEPLNEVHKEPLPEKIVTKSYHYRFYNKEIGIIPRIESELLNWRQSVKNLMKSAKGNYKNLLNARQLAIKITCNSLYGFFGTGSNGMRPCPEIASCTTAKAREYIQQAFTFIESKYNGTILAADTDSAMFTIPTITNRNQCNYMGNLIAQEISGVKKGDALADGSGVHQEDKIGIFPPYIKFVHEKDMLVCYLCKKKYFAWFIKADGSFKKDKDGNNELLVKGIVLARRDNALILSSLYRKLVDIILSKQSIVVALKCLFNHLDDIYSGKFAYEHFTTIGTLGSNYKNPNYAMALFQSFLLSQGKMVKPGERLEYIIVKNPYAKYLGQKMVLSEQYLENLNSKNAYEINYDYYIEKKLMNPINQLFECGFKKELSKIDQYAQFKLGAWRNPRGLSNIIEVILKAKELDLDYTVIIDKVSELLEETK